MKERIEEQGNVFDEACYTSDKRHGGFTWNDTPERKNFWVDVLTHGKHHVFYERYPREINFNKPFRKDDIVKCISNSFNSNTKVIGKHFRLREADTNKLNTCQVASLVSYPSGTCNEFHVNFSSTDLVIVARAEINLSEQSKQTVKMETKSDFKEGESYLDERVGTEYVVISGNLTGKVVTLKRHDGTSAPLFAYIDGDGDEDTTYIAWKRLKRNSGYIPQLLDFEDESYPDEKEGTQYLVFMGKWEGETVILHRNDASSMPRFRKASGETSWLEWRCLKRTCQVVAAPSTDRYRVKTLQEFGNERPEDWDDDGEMDYLYGHELTKEQIERYLSRNNNENNDFIIEGHWWIRCNDIVKIETNNFTLNTTLNLTDHGSKVNSNSNSTFISRIPSTVSYGTTPRGVAVSCSRGKIRMGG